MLNKKLKKKRILWSDEPANSNYPSALSYLSLIFDVDKAEEIVDRMLKVEMSEFKARDIFRASGLPLLGISQHQIQRNYQKMKLDEELSPLLLVRDKENRKVIVADGYHRLCAVYHYHDDAIIPCKIV